MNNIIYKILLADDDRDDCFLFSQALAELPIQSHLTTVYNGEEFCEHIFSEKVIHPDIIFLDLNMPRKNGFDCLKEIKANNNLNQIPIIIVSTSDVEFTVQQVYDNGAVQFIKKPNDFNVLKNVIARALFAVANKKFAKPSYEHFILK